MAYATLLRAVNPQILQLHYIALMLLVLLRVLVHEFASVQCVGQALAPFISIIKDVLLARVAAILPLIVLAVVLL